tara:strand:- start:718 stop:1308 length:591 start_codon:yes stop_codon:yes gene_type:complete
MRFFNIICLLYFLFTFFSCENNSSLPKQDAFLRIEFNEPNYLIYKSQNSKIDFLYNASASSLELASETNIDLDYKKLGMSLDLSFDKLNDETELANYLRDFNLLLDAHTKRSNGFLIKEFENRNYLAYGKLYEFRGDVASPIQFFLTDSINNFIHGSLNMTVKSKYDSIYPSVQYVKNDILVFFESINFKKNNEAK